jgi:hypothetical protein
MNDFVKSWKIAGEEMERLRNERLRCMPEEAGARLMGAVEGSSEEKFYAHGLAKWQRWMMRWRVQLLMKQLEIAESRTKLPNVDA